MAQTGAVRGRRGRLSVRAVVEVGWSVVSGYRFDRIPDPYELRVERLESESRRRGLVDKIGDASEGLERLGEQVRAERVLVDELETLLEGRRRLFAELERLHLRARDAETNLRRAERSLTRERAREVEPDTQGDRVRRGQMVKVSVDDGAWVVFEVDAKRRRRWLGWELGQLVAAEVALDVSGDAVGLPVTRRRRGPGEGEPCPVLRSLRIFVDEDLWPQFAALVSKHPMTIGRYVGELVEAEAHRLGWRAGGE